MTDPGRLGALRLIATIDLELRPVGPLLIKGPEAFIPDAPDMAFIRMPTPDGMMPFLPGSSLKGVLRSGTEALLRAMDEQVCDSTSSPCAQAVSRCRTCLLFGSVHGASVVTVEDGLPWPPDGTPEERVSALARVHRARTIRTGVAIDRQTGAAAPNKLFDLEALVNVSFFPRLTLRNPAAWQAAALCTALQLLDDGILRIGSGTTRGFGRVRVVYRTLSLRSCGRAAVLSPLTSTGLLTPRPEPPWTVWQSSNVPATFASWADNLEQWLRGNV